MSNSKSDEHVYDEINQQKGNNFRVAEEEYDHLNYGRSVSNSNPNYSRMHTIPRGDKKEDTSPPSTSSKKVLPRASSTSSAAAQQRNIPVSSIDNNGDISSSDNCSQ